MMTPTITTLCQYAECCCAEYHDLFIEMLNVIKHSIIMLSVVAPSLCIEKIQ
jgi:hypothetical protein